MTTDASITIRNAEPEDRPAILELLGTSLGWLPDEDHAGFFAWKHDANPFGPSPAWVATADGRVVGLRVFMRWEFDDGGRVRRAVRAVDTATHPDFQGRGVFSSLTKHALGDLEGEGVDFVYNTPNANSLPGYLKMGWQEVGRLPVLVRFHNPLAAIRLLGPRTIASRWGMPSTLGAPAAEALADPAAVGALDQLLASQPKSTGLSTNRTGRYLRWRFGGFAPLGYRIVLAGQRLEDGVAFFRLRNRGSVVEAGIGEVLAPSGDEQVARSLLLRISRRSGADYAIRLAGTSRGAGYLKVPWKAPMLTWRGVCSTERPPLADWRLTLADAELF